MYCFCCLHYVKCKYCTYLNYSFSLTDCFYKCMPSFTCHYWPSFVFLGFTALNSFVQDLSCCFFSPHSPVFISHTWVCQSSDISIQNETIIQSLPQGMPWAPTDLLPCIYLKWSVWLPEFFLKSLNEWTPPEALPEEITVQYDDVFTFLLYCSKIGNSLHRTEHLWYLVPAADVAVKRANKAVK